MTRPDFGSLTRAANSSPAPVRFENPIVIVAAAEFELLIVCADALADGVRLAEIEGRAVHFAKLAGGDQAGVDGREPAGVDGEDMIEDFTGTWAGKIEIGVVGQIDDGVRSVVAV